MIRLGSLALLGLIALSGLSGCRQGVGDRCQVTGDCQSNLICVIPAGETAVTGGTCQPQGTSDASSFQTNDLVQPLLDFSTPGTDASTL
jgi:hypothetical protein